MTDPSYAGQIVTFTFPHIGNVGVNPDDDETADPVAAGMVVKWDSDRAGELARRRHARRLARASRPDRGGRGRHPAADAGDPAPGGAARGDQPCPGRRLRPRRPDRAGARLPRAGGHGPRPRRHLRPELPVGRDALGLARGICAARGAGPPRGGDRLRGQAQHPALPRHRRLRRDGAPGDRDRRRGAGARPGGSIPVERARRSGRHRRVRGADDQGDHGPQRHADLRHLPRPPDAGAGARGADHQDEPRASRGQSSGQGAGHRQGRRSPR